MDQIEFNADFSSATPYTVIVANGSFPTHPLPVAALEHATQIICCDGAAQKLVKNGYEPDVIIGDLDSISEEMKITYADRLIQIVDDSTNDLTKAVYYAKEKGIEHVVVVGATGEREDHALGNIALLAVHHSLLDLQMLTDYGWFGVISESSTIQSFKGQQVSIFSPFNAVVSSENLKYPLNNYRLDSWYKGTLNEALGDYFKLKISEGEELIVFQEYSR